MAKAMWAKNATGVEIGKTQLVKTLAFQKQLDKIWLADKVEQQTTQFDW